jgi:Protein of unknown function, DUF547
MRWICLLFIAVTGVACGFDREYTLYGALLQRYTDGGMVCYASMKCDCALLGQFLDEVSNLPQCEYCRWCEEDRAAFWINAYNALALHTVLKCYPILSIRQVGCLVQGILDRRMLCVFGMQLSFNQIERLALRAYFDARIHFALAPATLGGAALRCEPYVGWKLDCQLRDQADQFMAHRAKNYIEGCVCSVYVSPLFKWYQCDFDRDYGSIWAFIRPYFRAQLGVEVFEPCWQLHFSHYDWMLNDRCSCLGDAYAEVNVQWQMGD